MQCIVCGGETDLLVNIGPVGAAFCEQHFDKDKCFYIENRISRELEVCYA